MKKIFSITVAILMLISLFAACTGSNAGNADATGVKTGLGQVVSIAASKDVSEKDGAPVDGVAQVDTVMAAVSVDGTGKILSVTIDNAQTKVAFNNEGKITADRTAAQKTKVELGDAYGMKKQSAIGKEWFQQIAALEQWMVGKTIDQVKAMKTYEKDATHPKVPDEADLKTSVTISVQDYIAAVEEAVANAK